MRLRARRLLVPAAALALAGLTAAPLPASAGSGPAVATAAVGGPLMAGHGTVVQYLGRPARQLPAIPASAWVVANASTGQVLAAKNPHGRFGPASTMKVLTAITLIPLLKPGAMVLASKQAADTEPMDAGLVAGRRYRVADLFTALLTISANDAAVALTQATGSFSKGMALINAEAHHLQAYDVVAKQPNGLPADGQVESAYDEALIARQALASPEFMKYDSTLAARFEVKPRHFETLVNQNWLLTKYRGALGGKIGWTVNSEATYVGLARRNGVTLIVTILHCTPLQEITSAVKLLNWGFAMNAKVSPVGTLVPPLAPRAAKPSAARNSAARNSAARPGTATASRAGNEASLAKTSAASPASLGRQPGRMALYAGAAAAGLGVAAVGLGGLVRRRRLAGRHRGLADPGDGDPGDGDPGDGDPELPAPRLPSLAAVRTDVSLVRSSGDRKPDESSAGGHRTSEKTAKTSVRIAAARRRNMIQAKLVLI